MMVNRKALSLWPELVLCLAGLFMLDSGVTGQKSMGITWPENCSTSVYLPGKKPRAHKYSNSRFTDEASCKRSCDEDRTCGLYLANVEKMICNKYQLTTRMMAELGLPDAAWIASHENFTIRSKACPAEVVGSDCNQFPVTHNRTYPLANYLMELYVTRTYTFNSTQCLSLCLFYTDCLSARYFTDAPGKHFCQIFNTTVTQLLEDGMTDMIETSDDLDLEPESSTYERHCTSGAYNPENYMEKDMSPAVVPIDLLKKVYNVDAIYNLIDGKYETCFTIKTVSARIDGAPPLNVLRYHVNNTTTSIGRLHAFLPAHVDGVPVQVETRIGTQISPHSFFGKFRKCELVSLVYPGQSVTQHTWDCLCSQDTHCSAVYIKLYYVNDTFACPHTPTSGITICELEWET